MGEMGNGCPSCSRAGVRFYVSLFLLSLQKQLLGHKDKGDFFGNGESVE